MNFAKVVSSRTLVVRRQFHGTRALQKYQKEFENPLSRTWRILSNTGNYMREEVEKNIFPSHVDIAIIGGGAVGCAIAYFLKEKSGKEGLKVLVIEKDPTYSENTSVLSVGGLRQQFSLRENIEMSVFGAEFLRTLKRKHGSDGDVRFVPHGYLTLASEHNGQLLLDNSKFQNELGAVNTVLSKKQLKERFPWLNVEDVEAGCLGLEKEGWFDPWTLLKVLRSGSEEAGTRFLKAEVVEFTFQNIQDIVVSGVVEGTYEGIDEVVVQLPNGDLKGITASSYIIASGWASGKIAKMARVGAGPGMLQVPLPVEKRKRFVYCFHCPDDGPGINTPMTIDHTGAYFRREGLGGLYIGGMSPDPEDEPDTSNLEVDYNFFDEKIWPKLAQRVPAFNNLKVNSAWAGYYDYNTFDENGIIGVHPYYYNLMVATGFSGHGIQQSPAVGRAIAELILDGEFKTIDLTRLGFDRLMAREPMYEVCIY